MIKDLKYVKINSVNPLWILMRAREKNLKNICINYRCERGS